LETQTRSTNIVQEAAATPVYVDQSLKKARERRLVITGLDQVSTQSDAESFAVLYNNELHNQHIQPNNISAKRLGHPIAGKTQSLLVIMKQAYPAQQIFKSVKLLCKSLVSVIHDRVFTNPQMTKAEAAAAYQVRQQRRLTLQRYGLQDSRDSRDSNKLQPGNHSEGSREDQLPRVTDSSEQSALNPSAIPFSASVVAAHLVQRADWFTLRHLLNTVSSWSPFATRRFFCFHFLMRVVAIANYQSYITCFAMQNLTFYALLRRG
jgi:hypothetical protein